MPTPIETECQVKYGIDFEQQVQKILPYFWSFTIGTDIEKTVFLNYVWTLFSQLKPLNQSMVDFCSFITTRLNYTGQRKALIEMLNDTYDNTLRRITLNCIDNNFVEGLDIYLDSEVNDPNSIFGKSFVVHVPVDVVESDELIRALLDIYVIAPQEYLIIRP